MGKIKFDFFNDNKDLWLSNFCRYYELRENEVRQYFRKTNPDVLTPSKLVIDLALNLNIHDSGSVEIVGRHMTTTSEEERDSFISKGLLDLRTVLQSDSPLSRFLAERDVQVKVDERTIVLDSNEYCITSYGEPCERCYQNKEKKCTSYIKCDLRQALDRLGLKLYKYGATVEFFIHASYEKMSWYSSIRHCPEILQTLDTISAKALGQYSVTYDLCYAWMKINKKCYVLEFIARLSEMENYPLMHNLAAYHEYKDCFTQSGYDYNDYIEKIIPQRVYDNLILLQWFVSIYFYDSDVLGSLLPNKSVPPDSMKLIEVT